MDAIFYIFIGIAVVSIILFINEAKNAPIVDDKEPFLYGDYDAKKDVTRKI